MEKSGIYILKEKDRKKAKLEVLLKTFIFFILVEGIIISIYMMLRSKIKSRWTYLVLIIITFVIFLIWYLRHIRYNNLKIKNYSIKREDDKLYISLDKDVTMRILINDIKDISIVKVLFSKNKVKVYIKVLKRHMILISYLSIKELDKTLDILFTPKEISELIEK